MLNKIYFIFLITAVALSARVINFSGTVVNSINGSPVAGADIRVENSFTGTTTNEEGRYILSGLPAGNHTLIITHVGFKQLNVEISLENTDTQIYDFKLTPSAVELGEVTVTGTRFPKTMHDVSMPVEVSTREDFEQRVPNSVAEVSTLEPGVEIGKDGMWATELSIRGLRRENLVILIDGNRVETSTAVAAGMSLVDPDETERIEIIKGGTSSLYGSGAIGGVVNIITRTGTYNNNFRINGSLSSGYNTVNEGNTNSVKLNAGSDIWYARASFTQRSATDAETPEGTLPDSRFRDYAVNAEAGIKPLENHELKLDAQYFDATDVGIPGGATFPATASARYSDASRQMYSAEYTINNILNNAGKVSARYFFQKIRRDVELRPSPAAVVTPGADHTMHGASLNFNYFTSKTNSLTAGVDFWQREYEGLREKYVIPQDMHTFEKPVPDSKFRSLGLFAQDNIILLDKKLDLTLGARYDFINVTNDAVNNPLYIIKNSVRNDNPPVNSLASYDANDVDNHSWSANLSAIYKLNPSFDFTLNAAHAFRSPNLEERYQFIELAGQTYLGNPSLEPEKSWFFDLGFRCRNDIFSFRANGYINILRDLVSDRLYATDVYRNINVGKARIYGYEAAAEASLYKGFRLYANLTYARGEDVTNDDAVNLPQIAPFNGIAGIKSPVLAVLSFDLSGRFVSAQDNTAPGESATPGYAVYNVSLSSVLVDLNYVSLKFYAGVENIFDRLYKIHLSTYRGLNHYEPGRNIYFKAVMNF